MNTERARGRDRVPAKPYSPVREPITVRVRQVWVAPDGSEHRTRRDAIARDGSRRRSPKLETRRVPVDRMVISR